MGRQLRPAHGAVGAAPLVHGGAASRDPLQGPLPHTDGLRGLLRASQDSREDSVKRCLVPFHKGAPKVASVTPAAAGGREQRPSRPAASARRQ